MCVQSRKGNSGMTRGGRSLSPVGGWRLAVGRAQVES